MQSKPKFTNYKHFSKKEKAKQARDKSIYHSQEVLNFLFEPFDFSHQPQIKQFY
jgi:hypothetical protein